ncbi:hypothetical protein J3F84DRAFT_348992 [Trichoderma pleuroticola]
MQLTSSVIAALGFAVSVAADSLFCQPTQNVAVPQSILGLDASVKLNWATTLCNQLNFPADGAETALTALADGIEAPEDGHLYGLELTVHDIQSAKNCIVNAQAIFNGKGCPSGGLLTLSGPLTQSAFIAKLN